MEKLPLLYNLKSGRAGKSLDDVLRLLPGELRERLQPVELCPPWDYRPHIEAALRFGGPLLVWGGDGTLHYAARALIDAGCPVSLAGLPGGSGNGLVRGLQTPLKVADALMALMNGRDLMLDLPRLDGVPFLNVCGTGFEASVAHEFEKAKGRGFLEYATLCLKQLNQSKTYMLHWESNNRVVSGGSARQMDRMDKLRQAALGPDADLPTEIWTLCLANLPQYGSGLWIAPAANPTDGCLHWATLDKPEFWDVFGIAHLFKEGAQSHLRRSGRLGKPLTLRLEQSLPFHLDGEAAPARDRAEFSIEARAFPMRVTRACPWT